ncbi:MAG: PepSY domain-containing protein [Pseudomonadota bacterium]
MTVKSIWLRRIHKWVGLVIGLQFLIWAISGTAMALLDMDEVAGGATNEQTVPAPKGDRRAWPRIQRALASQPISKLSTRALPSGLTYEVTTADGVKLFDAANGSPVMIDRAAALSIAGAAHPGRADVARVLALRTLPLAVREHELPIWQVDFRDEANSSYFVSGTTGQILERRNDTWRWWDFFWMLHNMDYANRTSFNHPLIIMVGFALSWLAVTGFWLLFRTMWRHDFAYLRKLRAAKLSANKLADLEGDVVARRDH